MVLHLRGGQGTQPPVPPVSFGPTNGAQSVRDGAKPSSVTDPGGGISFTSRADLQSKIDANVSNSIFVAAADTTYNWDAAITDGGKHPRIYFLGNPATTIVDGQGREIAGLNGSESGGEVHGATWKNFGTALETGVSGRGLHIRGGWTVEDVICESNFRVGISCQTNSYLDGVATGYGPITVRRAIVRSNGRYGITGTIETDPANNQTWALKDSLFEDIEITDNNTRQVDVTSDAGGTKFSGGCHDSTWRRIWTHDNYGVGIWWDGQHFGNTAEDIVSENNRNWGGFVELGYGSSTFQRWYLKDNGVDAGDSNGWFNAVQFLVSCVDGTQLGNTAGARGTTVAGGTANVFRDSIIDGSVRAMGIITHDGHDVDAKAMHFLHNLLWLRLGTAPPNPAGQVGGQDTDTIQVLWDEPDIVFDENEYHVADVSLLYWKWDTGSGQGIGRTWAQWQGYGHDPTGSMVVI